MGIWLHYKYLIAQNQSRCLPFLHSYTSLFVCVETERWLTLGRGENSCSVLSHSNPRHSPTHWHVGERRCLRSRRSQNWATKHSRGLVQPSVHTHPSVSVICVKPLLHEHQSFHFSLQLWTGKANLFVLISAVDLLFMDLVAGDEGQIAHVRPGQLPALLSQVLKGRVLSLRSWNTTDR